MRRIFGITALLAAAGCAGGAGRGTSTGGAAAGTTHGDPALIATIDSIVEAPIKAGKVAGASIAVVKGSDTIAVQAFGKASIELDVPTPPHAIYQIGSVTKQFTAASIMQLVSEGKLSLDDDFTKYLPDYNTHGRKITVGELLNHTSGIKGYTEIPEFRVIGLQHLPKDTLIKIIENKPFDFEPGAEETYNNSAFFLAGLIIEKVSGMSYADYVQKNLFDKAGMKDAHYCSERVVHPRDVDGYDTDSTGLVKKGFIDHTWPYAAGSLCSSAIDLVAWDQALHGGKILDPAAYQEFIKPGELGDGTKLRYAKGLAVSRVVGHRAFHHGGGINGFLSENIYFPDDSLAVVVLYNTAGPVNPDGAARAIAEAILGKPADESKPFDGDLAQFAGTYTGNGRGRATELTIAVDGGKLTAKMPFADSAQALTYLGNDTFGGQGDAHFTFRKQGDKVTGLDLDVAYGFNRLKKK
jgi:CubicO group peptidase (beta-lactamase class C family)